MNLKSRLLPFCMLACLAAASCGGPAVGEDDGTQDSKYFHDAKVGKSDWNQWAGGPHRNNTPEGKNIPMEWDLKTGKNILWVSPLGSQTYGNPVVANGQVYVGTNNGSGWLKRFPSKTDLGCLLAFKEDDGSFLWQASSTKLPTGRVHDWPLQGICCAPLVEGERLWYVTSRGEVACLDTQGFRDEENDGPYKDEKVTDKDEADVIWMMNMMDELGVSQHNMCSCSVTSAGDWLFVNTSNGVDEGHLNLPAPNAPSFICVDKNTGKVLWTSNRPGTNVVHGQWSSPSFGVFDGQPQVLFAGGDGWLYSFDPAGDNGKAKLLWEFDCNPKTSKYSVDGRATRNHLIGTPLIHDGKVFIAVGEDPEHGEGPGHLWCIDPTKRGDVSPELVFNKADPDKSIAHHPERRLQAAVEDQGDIVRPNPNSAALWHYSEFDRNGDGKLKFDEQMHRTCGTCVIKDDILYIADFSGLFHCLDAKTGKPYWTYDMLAASWGSALIVDGKVFIGDEDGDVAVFKHSKDPDVAMVKSGKRYKPQTENNMKNSVYSTPVVANDTLFISNKKHLFAIKQGAQLDNIEERLKHRPSDSGDE